LVGICCFAPDFSTARLTEAGSDRQSKLCADALTLSPPRYPAIELLRLS
jgi:hypothetical protein